MGSVDGGNLVSDFDDEEKSKKHSVRSAMGFVEADGVKINIIDTPGTAEFVSEARAAVQAVEAVILVVDSVDGVQIETEKWWRYLGEKKIPRIIFVNKMDKERAGFQKVMENVKSSLKANVAPFTLPQGEAESFSGVVDIIDQKLFAGGVDGKAPKASEISSDMKASADENRSKLVELAAEGDDALIEKFFDQGTLSDDEVWSGLKAVIADARITPMVCGSAAKVLGIHTLLQIIKNYSPAPKIGAEYEGHDPAHPDKKLAVVMKADAPFAAVVWKTHIDQYAGRFNYLKVISGELLPESEALNSVKNVKERVSKIFSMLGNKQEEMPKLTTGDIGVLVKLDKTATKDTLCDAKRPVVLPLVKLPNPVFSYAIVVLNKADVDKVGQYFARVSDENPSITYSYNAETQESVLSGMGEMQLNMIINHLKEKSKVEVLTREPRVPYRETITKKTEAHYRHKKQSGGHGQFGEVFIRMAPLARGGGYEFKESIFGGAIPKQYIPGCEKGIVDALQEGVLGKFPVVDVSVDLFDGKYHDVDSSEMSFRIAARSAFKEGMLTACPQLLEPIMDVHVFVDKEFMGDILSDVTSRRGKVLGMDSSEESGGSVSVVHAAIPLAEMLRYTIDLRGMTSGKATFEMKFSHYDPIGGREADNVIAARKKQIEEEANK
jgi:elongation factor G